MYVCILLRSLKHDYFLKMRNLNECTNMNVNVKFVIFHSGAVMHQMGNVLTYFLISVLAFANVKALEIEMGHVFQIFIASVMHDFCIIGLVPGTINFP